MLIISFSSFLPSVCAGWLPCFLWLCGHTYSAQPSWTLDRGPGAALQMAHTTLLGAAQSQRGTVQAIGNIEFQSAAVPLTLYVWKGLKSVWSVSFRPLESCLDAEESTSVSEDKQGFSLNEAGGQGWEAMKSRGQVFWSAQTHKTHTFLLLLAEIHVVITRWRIFILYHIHKRFDQHFMNALACAQGEQRIVLQAESLKKGKWDNRHQKIRCSHSRVMIPSWFSSIMTDTLMCSCWLWKHGKLGSSLAHAPSCPLRTGTQQAG